MISKDDLGLDQDLFECQRDRIASDTCFSSSNWQGSGNGSNELVPVCELSFPIEEQVESFGHLSNLQSDCNMKDTLEVADQDFSLDLIGNLQPVSVAAGDEESTESAEAAPEIKISREGKRKKHVSQAASMIKHNVRRRKKTEDQVAYLRTLFDKLGGKWDGKVRKEAMKQTGLSRI